MQTPIENSSRAVNPAFAMVFCHSLNHSAKFMQQFTILSGVYQGLDITMSRKDGVPIWNLPNKNVQLLKSSSQKTLAWCTGGCPRQVKNGPSAGGTSSAGCKCLGPEILRTTRYVKLSNADHFLTKIIGNIMKNDEKCKLPFD